MAVPCLYSFQSFWVAPVHLHYEDTKGKMVGKWLGNLKSKGRAEIHEIDKKVYPQGEKDKAVTS